MNQQLINDLKGTRKRLEDFGWCQNTLRNLQGQHCLVGGVGYSICQDPEAVLAEEHGNRHEAVIGALQTTLRERGFKTSSLIQFNDTAGRSKEEIFKLIDDTIQRIQ